MQTRYERMLHSRQCSGQTICIIFSKLKLPNFWTAWRCLNCVNGISLPIKHTIDMHHHKQGKPFFASPYLRISALAIRIFSALIAKAAMRISALPIRICLPLYIARAALRIDLIAVSPRKNSYCQSSSDRPAFLVEGLLSCRDL